jgi:hypothetical protein
MKEIAFRATVDPKARALVGIDIKTHEKEQYLGKARSSVVDHDQNKGLPINPNPNRYKLFNYRGVFVGYGPSMPQKHGTAGNPRKW